MTTGHDRLIKEIDTLTYNARTILNALQRSVMAGSSSTGFTVTRFGVELTLTRPLIYRLFKFYEAWGNNNFQDFDGILAAQDSIPVRDENGNPLLSNPVTLALVMHSKILYISESDIVSGLNTNTSGNTAVWLGKIKTAPNPRLITNSAPIPLNLRTPLFDENLSTTKYLTSETYLFPYAYFALDILGYSGDLTPHHLGGLSWDISADETIRLKAHDIAVGGANPLAPFKKDTDRTRQPGGVSNYGFAWGYDTHARGDFSTAGGVSSMALGKQSVAIGAHNIAYDQNSVVFGFENISAALDTTVLAGHDNVAAGHNSSILSGKFNVTGEVFPFTVWNPPDNLKTLTVLGDASDSIKVGDTYRFFNFKVGSSVPPNPGVSFTDVNGSGINFVDIVISDVSVSPNGEGGVYFGGPITPGQIITDIGLQSALPKSLIAAEGILTGLMSRILVASESALTDEAYPGLNSHASGKGLIAAGQNQSVFGKYNKIDRSARIILGNGNSDSTRHNNLVIRDDYFAFAAAGDSDQPTFGIRMDAFSTQLSAGQSYLQMYDQFVSLGSGNSMNINASGPLAISWGTDLTLSGKTFGALPTNSKQRNHPLFFNNPSGPGNFLRLVKSGFFTATGDSGDLTLPVGIGIGPSNKAHVISLVHSENQTDEVLGSIDDEYTSLQIVYGAMDSARLDSSSYKIGVRKVFKQQNNANPYTSDWRYLAWAADTAETAEDVTAINEIIGAWHPHFTNDIKTEIVQVENDANTLAARVTNAENAAVTLSSRVTAEENKTLNWGTWQTMTLPIFNFHGGAGTINNWRGRYTIIGKTAHLTFAFGVNGTVNTNNISFQLPSELNVKDDPSGDIIGYPFYTGFCETNANGGLSTRVAAQHYVNLPTDIKQIMLSNTNAASFNFSGGTEHFFGSVTFELN